MAVDSRYEDYLLAQKRSAVFFKFLVKVKYDENSSVSIDVACVALVIFELLWKLNRVHVLLLVSAFSHNFSNI